MIASLLQMIFGRVIEFDNPEFIKWSWLAILFISISCLIDYWLTNKEREQYAHFENLNRTTAPISKKRLIGAMLAWQIVTLLIAFALAGPFTTEGQVAIPEGSTSLVVVVDDSNSMASNEYRFALKTPHGEPPSAGWGSRLLMAVATFADQVFTVMPGNKIGIVTYTSEGYQQAPLCDDFSTLKYILLESGWVSILGSPGDGSDYMTGLKIAIETLRSDFDPNKKQVIMLFSDGGVPELADADQKAIWQKESDKCLVELEALKKECHGNLKLIIVGVGGKAKHKIPIIDPRTNERVDWFPQGKEQKAETALEEANLKHLAEITGGKYIWLSPDSKTQLPIDWVEEIGGSNKTQPGKQSLFAYPLIAAMLTLALLLIRGKLRKSDRKIQTRFPRVLSSS